MNSEDVMNEWKIASTKLITKEHTFRMSYLLSEHKVLSVNPRIKYYQLKQNALWMTLYSHINWLAHFKYNKYDDVDKHIPNWLSVVFSWPEEISEAFWNCGRNPIAHTGSCNLPYNLVFDGMHRYIQLTFEDEGDWNGNNGYLALPASMVKLKKEEKPKQQTIFFFGSVMSLLTKLANDTVLEIDGRQRNEMLRMLGIAKSFNLLDDDCNLARMIDLSEVYDNAKKAEYRKKIQRH